MKTGDGPPPEVRCELEWILKATYLGWQAHDDGFRALVAPGLTGWLKSYRIE